MNQQVPMFFEIFSNLDKRIREEYPESYDSFSRLRGAMIIKFQLLDLIKTRFLSSQREVKDCFQYFKKRGNEFTISADPGIMREASNFSFRFDMARRSLKLDIESFLVFSRVVLDYLPWMLQPYLKGYLTRQEPATYDFRQFCEWFRDNSDKVIDGEFNEFLLSFYGWFMTNLRNPRNDLVIHLKRKYTLDTFSADGTIPSNELFSMG